MKCRKCGINNPINVNKCIYCGASLTQSNNPKVKQRNINNQPRNNQRKSSSSSKKQRTQTDNIIIGVIIALVAVLLIMGGIYAFNSMPKKGGFSGGGGGGGIASSATYKVTFDFNYDNLPKEEQTVKNGEYAQSPIIKERAGFVFGGWFEDKDLKKEFDFHTPIKRSYNLTACWVDMNDTTDTDGDGLTDNVEKYYGTDKLKVDTDGDGLSDYVELAILSLNPLKVDTDGNGKKDGDEDADKDKLSNVEEIKIGSDPTIPDTDADSLNDFDEVNKYKTNPIKADTDSDGVSDGKEIELGTDPLSSQKSFSVSVKSNESDTVKPSVSVNLSGKQVESLKIEKVNDKNLFPETIPGYMGAAYDFSVDGSFNSATISFEFDSSKGSDPVIYHYNEKEGILEPLSTTVKGNIASANVSHFSTYILINRKVYEESFEWEDAWVTNSNYRGVEIVLVIDDSGSMKTNDKENQRLSVAKTLIDNLPENSKIGVVKFESNTEILTQSLTNSKSTANGFLTTSYFKSSGNTYMYSAIDSAMGLFESTDSTIMKLVVVLSDGATSDTSKHNNIVSSANSRDIRIYTVGLGSSSSNYFTEYLKPLANNTGAAFYLASNASELTNIYKDISKKIDIETDTDNDGVPDYYEENLQLFNGVKIKLDKNNPDTDGDGLLDGKEVELKYTYKDNNTKVNVKGKINSYPDNKDSDGDGLTDSKDKKPMEWDVCDRDLALFASLTYNTQNEYNSKSINKNYYNYGSPNEVYDYWTIVDCSGEKWADINTHFFATTYKNGNKIVIAYRGTDGEIGEWLNNLIGVGLINYHSEEGYAKNYASKIAKKYSDCDIYITGHSLGGYLAQFGAYEIIQNHSMNKLKKVAYFNGIGLEYFPLWNDKNDERNALKKYFNGSNLISYSIYGDVVNVLGKHSGKEKAYYATDKALEYHKGKHGSDWFILTKSGLGWLSVLASDETIYWYDYYKSSSLREFFSVTHEIDSFFSYLTQGTRSGK